MFGMFGRKVLHLLPEDDINTVLKEFGMGVGTGMKDEHSGFIAVERDSIFVSDSGRVSLKDTKKNLIIFGDNSKNWLFKLFPDKTIVKVEYIGNNDIFLNLKSYESVRNTFDSLKRLGCEPKSDRELIHMATHNLVPRKKLVGIEKNFGSRAFKGSNVYQYRASIVICYDISLIIGMSIA